MSDAKTMVINRLLEVARLMRRRGTPEQAAAALPYEQQLERDLEQHKSEIAELPGLNKEHEVAA